MRSWRLKIRGGVKYLRKWLPVFPGSRRDITIYDFFAGRGRDGAGNPGSPLIIVEEMKGFCEHYADSYPNITARMVFNDIEENHIEDLGNNVREIACDKTCCKFEFSAKSFSESLTQHFAKMQA